MFCQDTVYSIVYVGCRLIDMNNLALHVISDKKMMPGVILTLLNVYGKHFHGVIVVRRL